MSNENIDPSNMFDKDRASAHDKRHSKLFPIKESLHLLIRMVLSELPSDAKILCVGVGTGPELIELALHNPKWQFTAVEPSGPMLDICRQQADKNGISDRCKFHHGYLDSLSGSGNFHAATSLLVSQFITDTQIRSSFFNQIHSYLKPNGILINADLASDMKTSAYNSLKEVWVRTMKFAEAPTDEIEKLGKDVAVLPIHEIEAIIESGGFNEPSLFYQNLLIHAWFTNAKQ